MKKMHFLWGIPLALLTAGCARGIDKTAVAESIGRQMADYPQSTLRDIYKSFFQDRFGPGHLIADTAAAGRYLREELASAQRFSGPLYEPAGSEGNFYRVNLSVVKEGLVPYHVFLEALVRSAGKAAPVSLRKWKKEWRSVEAVVDGMNLQLPGYGQDRRQIAETLESGQVAMHHSAAYNAQYHPHYRIIAKEIFEKELLPLIKKE